MLGSSARLELPVEANDQPLGDPIIGMKEARQRGGEEADRAAGGQMLALVKWERAGHYLTLAVCEDFGSREQAQCWQEPLTASPVGSQSRLCVDACK